MLLVLLCTAAAVATVAIAAIVAVLRTFRLTWDHITGRPGPPLWVAAAEGSDAWRLQRRGHYVARYHGTSPVAAALTALAAPISVRDAIKACRQLGLECDLHDPWGEVVASIDKQGTVRIDVGDGDGGVGADAGAAVRR